MWEVATFLASASLEHCCKQISFLKPLYALRLQVWYMDQHPGYDLGACENPDFHRGPTQSEPVFYQGS